MTQCTYCGENIPGKEKFCLYCGKKTLQAISQEKSKTMNRNRCQYCHYECNPLEKYCLRCGRRIKRNTQKSLKQTMKRSPDHLTNKNRQTLVKQNKMNRSNVRCLNCGTELKANTRFCMNCGSSNSKKVTRIQKNHIRRNVIQNRTRVQRNNAYNTKKLGVALMIIGTIILFYLIYQQGMIDKYLPSSIRHRNRIENIGGNRNRNSVNERNNKRNNRNNE